jgi:4-hydroxy-3-methylbut-2-enyl diphosphate reductase IspH
MAAGIGTVEEIRIAKRTGFCYGVREAIDKAKEASAAWRSLTGPAPG